MSKKQKLLTGQELMDLSERVVKRYAYAIPHNALEDVRMSVIENYLKQEDKITQRFQGQSKTNTYAYAVLNRMCCSIMRKEFKHWQTEQTGKDDALHSTRVFHTAEQLLIEDEIRYLRQMLIMLNDNFKAVVFFAFYFLLKAKERFLKVYDKAYLKNGLLALLDPDTMNAKGTIFENLAKAQNKAEEKNVKADAVRMWLNKEMKSLIKRMNGPFGRANYTHDSFQILFEYYYDKE